jgi:hypothetical protein
MPQIFPKWANTAAKLAPIILVGGIVIAVFVVWYWFSPWNTDVGYQPHQPIAFSHKLHTSDLGIDCQYCHRQSEDTPFAGVPATGTCMNCHALQNNKENFNLRGLMASWQGGEGPGLPIPWRRVHQLPDYVYFDHSAHVRVGVGCVSCHSNVNEMDVVRQTKPLSMGWCLDCHANPVPHLRPVAEVTNMNYKQTDAHARIALERGMKLNAPFTDCSGCHR